MSCRLNPIAEFDVNPIEERLGSTGQTRCVESPASSSSKGSQNKAFHNSFIISLSPFGDIAVVANEKSAVVLTAKWNYIDDNLSKETFKVTSDIFISQENRGTVTAVLCLPLVFCGRDNSSRQLQENDWTCVAVGFSSGFVHFYDSASNLLFFKQPYSEPVVSLKCQSFQPANQKTFQDEYPEEIYIHYTSVLVHISGSVLFPLLREKRSHLAKVSVNQWETTDGTPISYKIWKFTKQEGVADCEVVGPSSAGLFDHLRCASLLGGFYAKYQAAPPKTTQLVACGNNDFVGFHYFFESVPMVLDWKGVLKSAVFTPVKGIFSDPKKSSKQDVVTTDELVNRFSIPDLGREGKNIIRSPNREYLAVTDKLGRVCVIDSTRGIALRLFKGYREAQCGWLAVEDESLDLPSGSSRTRAVVYLLAIYSPRSGRIEVWPVMGARVATVEAGKDGRYLNSYRYKVAPSENFKGLTKIYEFAAGHDLVPLPLRRYLLWKKGKMWQHGSIVRTVASYSVYQLSCNRLIYTPHRFVGLNNKNVDWSVHKWLSCVFLSSEGKLHDISVPFYYVLSEGDDRMYARDVHEIKKLHQFLRRTNSSEEEIAQEVGLVAAELKTTLGMLDCVKLLCTSRNTCPEAVEAAVSVIIDRVNLNREKHSSLPSMENLLHTKSLQLRNLTSLYTFVRKTAIDPPEYFPVVESSSLEQDVLCSTLFISHREASNLRMRLAMKLKRSTDVVKKEPVVTFKEKCPKSTFRRFLSCFKIDQAKNEDNVEKSVSLSFDLFSVQPSNEKVHFLSQLLFRAVVFSSCKLTKFGEELLCSGIFPIDLTVLATLFWLDLDLNSTSDRELIQFSRVIGVICQLEAEKNVASDYNELSPWWNKIRDMIMASTFPLNALTAAFACRSVAIRIECQIDAQYVKSAKLANENWSDSDDSSDCESVKKPKEKEKGQASDWEAMSADRTRWNLLIGLLEDVTILDCILSRNPRSESNNLIGTPLPILPYSKEVISVRKILQDGSGSISKMVARWIASSGIVAKSIVDSTDVEWQSLKERTESKRKGDIPATYLEELEGREAFASQGLRILKWHFPFSLTGSVVLMELCLCYFNEWNKDFTLKPANESLDLFEGAMSCLTQLPSIHIKKGLCVMIWNSFIWTRLHECLRYLGFFLRIKVAGFDSRPEYSDWLSFSSPCLSFVRLFAEVCEICDLGSNVYVDSVFYQHEDLWESNMVDCVSPASTLSSVLTLHNAPCIMRLPLVLQIASVMQMMLELNIYFSGGINALFGSNAVFQKVIQVIDDNMDMKVFEILNAEVLAMPRYNFLSLVVKAAHKTVSSLPLDTEMSPATKRSMESALRWMSRCEELVSMWNLDYDELRRYQVCLLYSAGFDSIAQEIVPAVREKVKLASSLISIARQRLALYVEHSPDLAQNLSLIGPALGNEAGVLSVDSDEVRQVSLNKTLHLLRFAVSVNSSPLGNRLLNAVAAIVNAR